MRDWKISHLTLNLNLMGGCHLNLIFLTAGPRGPSKGQLAPGPREPNTKPPNPNPKPKSHRRLPPKPHIPYCWAKGPPKGQLAPGPRGPTLNHITLTLNLNLMGGLPLNLIFLTAGPGAPLRANWLQGPRAQH